MFRCSLLMCALALCSSTLGMPDRKVQEKPLKLAIEPVIEIGGYYSCQGVDGGGKTYKGLAAISRQKEVYLVQWMVDVGTAFTGIGIRQGNTLSVSWALPPNKEGVTVCGINVYKIHPGRLVGKWATLPGNGVQHDETLTFLKGFEIDE